MIKNRLHLLFTSLVLLYASSTMAQKRISKPHYAIDSIAILSPHVEVYNSYAQGKSEPDQKLREKIYEIVINETKKILTTSQFIDLPLMSEDYRSINRVVERKYVDLRQLNSQIEVPLELLTTKSKYALFLTVSGRYGYYSNSMFRISIINNETKKIEYYYELTGPDIKNEYAIKKEVASLIKKVLTK